MNGRDIRSDGLLLLTALIWGLAFVAQRVGMAHVGPFTFNGVRFALGCLVLLPLVLRARPANEGGSRGGSRGGPGLLVGGTLAGAVLFAGASLQQVGLVHTTAGNAGFITGLYVVIVPVLGLLLGQRANAGSWIGALLAAAGLYLLCITEGFTMAFGDLLELLGAVCWAGHVLLIGWLSPRADATRLAFVQFAACSALSLLTASFTEAIRISGLLQAAVPIVYGGAFSVGVAYTLQVVAQRHAHPPHAAILLSLEAVFAALGGWLLLDERLSPRGLLGCGLMLAGMLLSQLWTLRGVRPEPVVE
jgi:drug/metabolite transporter (DMT)-like permease